MKSDFNTDPQSSKLPVLQTAIGKPVVVRVSRSRFAREPEIAEIEAVLIAIHTEDGTITAQDATGNLYRVSKYEWSTRKVDGAFWHWPDAPEPEDPKDFKPTHFPRGGPQKPPKRVA